MDQGRREEGRIYCWAPSLVEELEDLFIRLGAEKCALTHTTVIKTSFYTSGSPTAQDDALRCSARFVFKNIYFILLFNIKK